MGLQLAAMLTQEWLVTVKDVAGITGAGIKFDLYDVVLFLTSTYGSGAAPASSTKSVWFLHISSKSLSRACAAASPPVHIIPCIVPLFR